MSGTTPSDAGPEPFGIPPAPYRVSDRIRLGPVRLQVADLERSMDFYASVLGLVATEGRPGERALHANGGREPLIELAERPGARPAGPRGRLGLFHYALLVPDRASLARFLLHAERLGVRLGMSDHDVSEALYLSDPDGHGIEVYADRPRAAWRVHANQLVMTTARLDVADLLEQAEPRAFDGLPADTVMGHVHLHVDDLARGSDFYHDALGLDKVVWNYPGALFLSAGGYHHHVGTNSWAAGAPAPAPDDAQLLAWTLVLPTRADVERLVEHAASRGFASRGVGTRGGSLIEDPWGTAVEVVPDPES